MTQTFVVPAWEHVITVAILAAILVTVRQTKPKVALGLKASSKEMY